MNPLRRRLCAAALLLAPALAGAADSAEVMGARYMRYEGCMVRRFGDNFYERLGIATAVNRWGAPEPTTTSLAIQPQSVIDADAACRKAAGIEKEPRPRG